jgi:very-short-patch-repair endonuclease
MSVKETLYSQRRALLDLTYRNRLLSLPKRPSSKSIAVHDERGDEVSRLLLQKTAMSFASVRRGETEEDATPEDFAHESQEHLLQPGDEEVDERGIANRHSDSKLQTKLTSEHLQKRLLSIYVEALTFQEEQGINALYLACGTLRYGEAESSELARSAPLLLIPVTLERKSAKDRFVLRWTEEEPQENLSLREKLRAEFGLKLPPFPDADSLDYGSYMSALAETISAQKGWDVRPDDIQLGFFSFSKLLMFLDLDAEAWPTSNSIADHRIISGLMGAGLQCPEPPALERQSLDDLVPVSEMKHVVDCDSSQALVIESVRRGHDLVIQGPPGTGKSQTITNLIATAITVGKKVLFLAEKAAALDVVHRRLTASNLGHACLVLHNKNANKRAVLQELGSTLALQKPALPDIEGRLNETQASITALNEHARRMHSPTSPAGFTPFEIFGELAKRSEQPKAPSLRMPDAVNWTRQRWEQLSKLAADHAASTHALPTGTANTWNGTRHRPLMRLEAEDLFEEIKALSAELERLESEGKALGNAMTLQEPRSIEEARQLIAIAAALKDAPEFDESTVSASIWNAGTDMLRQTLKAGQQASQIRTSLASQVKDSAFGASWIEHREVIEKHGRSLLRWFNGKYRSSLAELLRHTKAQKVGHEEQFEILGRLVEFEAARSVLTNSSPKAAEALGSLWCDLDTDWPKASAVVAWVSAQHRAPHGKKTLEVAASGRRKDIDIDGRARALSQSIDQAEGRLAALMAALNVEPLAVFDAASLQDCSISRMRAKATAWHGDIDGFMAWTGHSQLQQRLDEAGLRNLVESMLAATDSAEATREAFDRAFFQELARAAAAANPQLATFNGDTHNQLVERFAHQDRERLQLAQIEAVAAHHRGMPSFASGDFGVLGRLRTEIAKKRSQIPVRKLMTECSSAVQAIKPVFMMSPLSVAQFLPPGRVEFDLLVIDEASQVEPIDALGAIARCKQIVVVGDDNQLPPTAFFSRAINDEPEDDEDTLAQAKDVESILSLCSAKGVPMRRLRWHYRSKHESLIAVSNAEFYDHELFVVPSPDFRRAEAGLKHHFIESGRFDRGGTGQNAEEAAAIVSAVVNHARHTPELTLGVTAMSIRQRDAILDLLEVERRRNPELEAFVSKHPTEPFFVKNLESVQGDERDVILISIGYGKAKGNDRLYGNFGPLNAEGGHRRLNVLITRAKVRCEVFTSIKSGDIKITENISRGLTSLKAFLSYAETGDLAIPKQTGRGADSPFEEAVQKAISRYGFEVQNQVGVSGFFIDLAVVDPDQPGRYLIGIECDGAAYHSSASARDRDRLRQQILESQGWHIHRIWSTDWFQRPQQQVERVLEAIEAARAAPRRTLASVTPPTAPSIAIPIGIISEVGVNPAPRLVSAPADAAPANFCPHMPEPLTPAYVEAKFPCPDPDVAPHDAALQTMSDLVVKIVEVEGPIHEEEVAARIRTIWGLQRTGHRIVAAAVAGLEAAHDQGRLTRENSFYDIHGKNPIVRNRADAASSTLRKPEMLPPSEIKEAILRSARETMGIPREEAVILVSRMLGFAATSRQLRNAIDAQISQLLTGAKLREEQGLLRA